MDIIEEEGLMQHASKVGNYLKKHLFQLAEVHPNIGHVRGRYFTNIFLGYVHLIISDLLIVIPSLSEGCS